MFSSIKISSILFPNIWIDFILFLIDFGESKKLCFGFKKFNSLYIDLPNRGNLIIGENVNDECKYEILSISLNLGFTNESNILCANSASFWLLANIS